MEATYGAGEFWTNMNRQEMMELGLASQHQGEDFYTSLLQQGQEMKRLEKQLKKQGVEVSQPALKTNLFILSFLEDLLVVLAACGQPCGN